MVSSDFEVEIRSVLEEYDPEIAKGKRERLENHSGLSGAELWRIDVAVPEKSFCLRRWPEAVTPFSSEGRKIIWVHQVLKLAKSRGISEVMGPIPDLKGATLQIVGERIWELSPWAPGKADFEVAPSLARLQSVMKVIARFHQAVAPETQLSQPVPAIGKRLEMVRDLKNGGCDSLEAALDDRYGIEWSQLGKRFLKRFRDKSSDLEFELASFESKSMFVQACLGDVWHEHLFFEGEKCVGIIDFGAMRVDHIGTDLARVLGSLAGVEEADWEAGLAAYSQVQPLDEEEIAIVRAIDRANLLLSGLNWLRWLYLEGRVFPDLKAVHERLAHFESRGAKQDGLS